MSSEPPAPSPQPGPTDDVGARFLDGAVERGVLTASQAEDCRRVAAALDEVALSLPPDEIAVRKGLLSRAEADRLQRALARRRIGRYEVHERLGRGGDGVVHRAVDVRLGREVALKLLARPEHGAADVVERVRREARIASTLHHVHLVRGLDHGESDGYLYLAMELVDGESLSDRLAREGPLPPREAVRIARAVVDGLTHVHEHGLVHRDVKPANVLVTRRGVPKLGDLGLARPFALNVAGRSGAGTLSGTPLYVAPEQIRDPLSVDARADLYSLGATLFHLVTGRPPFTTEDGDVLRRHLEEPAPDPRELVLDLSPSLAAVILRLLAKSPEDRYPSTRELGADLDAVLAGRPPAHALRLEATVPTRPRPRATSGALHDASSSADDRTRRLPVAWAAVAGVVAVLLAVTSALLASNATNDAREETAAATRGLQDGGVGSASPADGEVVVDTPDDPADERDDGAAALARARALTAQVARAERLAGVGSESVPPSDADGDGRPPLADVIDQFEFVARRYADEPSGAAAREWLENVRARLEEVAAADLFGRLARAGFAEADGRHGDALHELRGFPARWSETRAAARLVAERERLTRSADAAASALAERIESAIDDHRFDDAQTAVTLLRRIGLPAHYATLDRMRQRLATARLSWRRAREEGAPAWRRLVGEALATDPVAGLRLLAAAESDGRLAAWSPETSRLAAAIDASTSVRDELESRWRTLTARDQPVELRFVGPARAARPVLTVRPRGSSPEGLLGSAHDDGRPVRVVVRIGELSAVSLGRILGRRLDDAEPAVRLARLVLLLRHGNLEAARDLLAGIELAEGAESFPRALVAAADERARRELTARIDDLEGRLARGGGAARGVLRTLHGLAGAHPGVGRVHRLVGTVHVRLRADDEALAAFDRAVAADEPDLSAHLAAARLLEHKGRRDEAEARLTLLAGADDVPEDLRNEAAAALRDLGAARLRERAEETRRLARRAQRRAQDDEAEQLWERLLKLVPGDADAMYELGSGYAETGRMFEAFVLLRTFVQTHPGDSRVTDAQAVIDRRIAPHRTVSTPERRRLRECAALFADGDVEGTVAAAGELLRDSPFVAAARRLRAEALLERFERDGVGDDLKAAAEDVRLSELLAPDRHDTRLLRTAVLLAEGRPAEALETARTAADERPDSEPPRTLAGRALLALDRPADALVEFEAAYERRRAAEPLYWQARAFTRTGRPQSARATLNRLREEHVVPEDLVPRIEALLRELEELDR